MFGGGPGTMRGMARIYMDCHATTPVDPRALEAMLPFFRDQYGNAASRGHAFGKEAARAVDAARAEVAALLGADPSEIVFTSGATESDNLAIKGAVDARRPEGRDRVVTVATEHPAVLDACKALERDGRAEVVRLPVGKDGRIDLDVLRAAVDARTALVSVMHANNEIGVIQDLAAIGAACREKGAWFHTDAAQSAGAVPLDVQRLNVDLASVSAHKMYGPKGVGALYVRKRGPRVKLTAQMDGGGHEGGLRSGTLPVPLIAGFGRACAIVRAEGAADAARILALRERLRTRILERIDHVTVNGSLEHRLPGNLHASFAWVEGESLILSLGDVAVSSGSACASAKLEPSHVLHALEVDEPLARASIRFGLGRFTTEAEVDEVVARLEAAVARLRSISPLYPGGANSRENSGVNR
jgi:cysteine desulfurase